MSQLRDIEGVGPVLFERSRRARHILLTVEPERGVRAAVPFGVAFDEAERFVRSKKKWIEKNLSHFKKKEEERGPELLEFAAVEGHFAKEKLAKRTEELAKEHGFTYNRLTIRNQKTLWGSCSGKNNLSLNMKLARLTDDLADYVILHELLHTRIKNHSKQFWLELDGFVSRGQTHGKTFGRAKKLDKKLRGYHLGLV